MCFWIFKRKKAKKSAEEKKVDKKVEEQPKKAKEEIVEEKPKEEKVAQKPKEEKVEAKPEEPKEVKDVYHVSLNKDEKSPHFKRWRVRKQGSRKTIQYFDTQLEAIDFAQDLADKADGSIVIHKMDGTIRKQNY